MREADRQALAEITATLEAELGALGIVDTGEAPIGPFGAENLPFVQWIANVLVPRLQEVLAGRAALPRESAAGVAAVREFDGWPEGAVLSRALSELDALVERAARHGPATRS